MQIERRGSFGLSFDRIFGGNANVVGSKTLVATDAVAHVGLVVDLKTLGTLTFETVTHQYHEGQLELIKYDLAVRTLELNFNNEEVPAEVYGTLNAVAGAIMGMVTIENIEIVGDIAYLVVTVDFDGAVGAGSNPLNTVELTVYATEGITGNVA